MIEYKEFFLDNGLQVILHSDTTTPLAAVNLLYRVGSRDEDPEKTGFAHLFEHLMFGGSVNIPVYDEPLQKAGGENNAFTNNDFTDYYITIPSQNIETAFWLESDRMLDLAFSQKSLEVQRKVVTEEFGQRYLNQPYGDIWLLLRPLAYQVHPYRWPTIGMDVSHIAGAKMEDVEAFYRRYYRPSNAILTIAGDFDEARVRVLSERWFGQISKGPALPNVYPSEPVQGQRRFLEVEREVPADMIIKAYQMVPRMHPGFHATDLLSDVLSNGRSSRLFRRLVMDNRSFSEVDAFITGDMDAGLFVLTGKPSEGISLASAEAILDEQIDEIMHSGPEEHELEKVKNKAEAAWEFSNVSILNRAMQLSVAAMMGDTSLVNSETDRIRAVSADDIRNVAAEMFRSENASVIYYRSKNHSS